MPCGRHRGEIEHPGGDWDGTAHFSGNQLVSTLMNSPPGRRSAEDLSTTGVVLPEIGAIKVRVVASHSPVRDVVDNDRLVRFAQSVPQGPTTRCALRPQPMRTRSGSSGSIVGIFSPVSSYLSLRQNRVRQGNIRLPLCMLIAVLFRLPAIGGTPVSTLASRLRRKERVPPRLECLSSGRWSPCERTIGRRP